MDRIKLDLGIVNVRIVHLGMNESSNMEISLVYSSVVVDLVRRECPFIELPTTIKYDLWRRSPRFDLVSLQPQSQSHLHSREKLILACGVFDATR